MTHVLAYLALGSAVGAGFLMIAVCMASGRKREAWEDDEQASILSAQTSKRLNAFPKPAVSAPR